MDKCDQNLHRPASFGANNPTQPKSSQFQPTQHNPAPTCRLSFLNRTSGCLEIRESWENQIEAGVKRKIGSLQHMNHQGRNHFRANPLKYNTLQFKQFLSQWRLCVASPNFQAGCTPGSHWSTAQEFPWNRWGVTSVSELGPKDSLLVKSFAKVKSAIAFLAETAPVQAIKTSKQNVICLC